MAVVYRHIRLDKNEPFYIGIGKEYKRAYFKKGRNKIWTDISKKSDYEVEILFDDLTWEEACEKEREFISLYGRIDLKTGTLANLTDGGDGQNNPNKKIRKEAERKRLEKIVGRKYNRVAPAWNKGLKGLGVGKKKPPMTEEARKNRLEARRNRPLGIKYNRTKPAWNKGLKKAKDI